MTVDGLSAVLSAAKGGGNWFEAQTLERGTDRDGEEGVSLE